MMQYATTEDFLASIPLGQLCRIAVNDADVSIDAQVLNDVAKSTRHSHAPAQVVAAQSAITAIGAALASANSEVSGYVHNSYTNVPAALVDAAIVIAYEKLHRRAEVPEGVQHQAKTARIFLQDIASGKALLQIDTAANADDRADNAGLISLAVRHSKVAW